MSFYLFLILLSLSIQCGISQSIINVTEENELEQFLCYNDPPVVGDTLVVLYTNITHYISGNVSFCMINTTYSLNITSNSSVPAIINCNQTGNHLQWPTTGFSFINVPSLTLQRLVFKGCGGFLKNSTIIDVIDSTVSPFHFTQYQSAVLLSPHINILLIENVTITSYYGFAILAINPMNATMNSLTISVTFGYFYYIISELTHIGSGALLYFTHDYTNDTHTVIINNSLITENIGDSDTKNFLKYSQNQNSVISAAGLTVLYTQTNYSANVFIFKTNITRNQGNILFFLHYKTSYGRTVFDQVSFESNFALSMALLLIMIDVFDASSPLLINSSVFNNTVLYKPQSYPSSVFFIGLYNPSLGSTVNINFNNSVFTSNTANKSGSCINAIDTGTQGKVLNIYLNNITAHNNFKTSNKFGNTKTELIKIDKSKELYISGYNNFSYNFGSIFDITNTMIYLNGQLNIIGNNGYMGTGFKVQGSSYFLLSNGLNATFINNTALTIGGAIYAIADDDFQNCMFQNNNENITDIKMTFIDNTATEAGSSIYTNSLHDCKLDSDRQNLMNTSVSDIIFSFSSNHRNISIPPTSLCLCNVDQSCITNVKNEYSLNVFIHPGQNIGLQLAAVYTYHKLDLYIIQYGYAAVTFFLIDHDNVHSVPSWQVSANSVNQALLEKQDCTLVTITLLKNRNEPNPSSPTIIVSSGSLGLILYGIQLLDCPIGFELNAAKGKCVCSRLLYKLSTFYQPDCSISSGADNSISTITRTDTEWIGIANLSNGTVVFGAALNCIVYCRYMYKSSYTKLIVNDTSVAIADSDDLSNSVPLCIDNREGLLCSQCPPGYSVVFGSYECKQCSNWWLFTLIIYAVIGPLLIYFMYVLKLTLTTGTLNGIIFCIQVLGFIDPPSVDKKGMNILLNGWTNYDLSFSLCLYNGMTELWKQGLLTMYQVYILSILLGIIVLSRFSVKISNKIANSSVQILVTVVHVSFSYLLTSIMEVFTPVTIYTNNTEEPMQVWFKYPTVEYGTHGHLVLMIITSLVVGPILGVYMTVLLAGRPLMRINYRIREYIRPVYEAIHAPYKRNKEFFFASRLLIVILLYVIYTCFRGKDALLRIAIASPILSVYIAVECLVRPFKGMSLNIFNLFLLSFSALIYGSSWYFMKNDHEDGLIIIIAVSNAAVFISFIGVIIIHILWVTGLLEKIKIKFSKYWSHCLPRQNQEEAAHVDMSGSFFEPYDRVREPLLSSH